MSALFVIGLATWMIGDGVAKLPNGGLIGAVAQIVGGILVALTVVI